MKKIIAAAENVPNCWLFSPKNGYTVRIRLCEFLWSDLPLPKEVLKVPHIDKSMHSYVEILLDNKWIVLDPNWDLGLENVFNANKWDGKSNTKIAVNPIKTLNPEESQITMAKEQESGFIEEDLRNNGEFYKAVNTWFEKIRLKK